MVGNSEVVSTGDEKIPFLIVAPTMRVPMFLPETVNPYLPAQAVFRLAKEGLFTNGPSAGQPISSQILRVAIPGLSTGVGKGGYNTSAHQMRAAINDVLLDQYEMTQSSAEASERNQLLYNKTRRLQC